MHIGCREADKVKQEKMLLSWRKERVILQVYAGEIRTEQPG
jgi:hypothetical protein